MMSTILTFFDANFIVILMAAAAYVVFRGTGAMAAAALGQYFVNASSLSQTYAVSGMGENCFTIVILLSLFPVGFFATIPSMHAEVLCKHGRPGKAFDILVFATMSFGVLGLNHCVMALNDVSKAGEAVWGAFAIAALFAAGAIIAGKFQSLGLAPADQHMVTAGVRLASLATEELEVTLPGKTMVNPEIRPTSVGGEALSKITTASLGPRPEPVSSTAYLFNRNEFFIYRHEHLKDLEDLLRRDPPGVLEGLHVAISQRLGRSPVAGDERAFLRAYVIQFRRRIEMSYPEYFTPERLEMRAA